MKRTALSLLILFLLTLEPPVFAQNPPIEFIPTGGLFAEQCDSAHAATLRTGNGLRTRVILDPAILMSMEYSPGVWEGYESATPFGGSYPQVLSFSVIYLYTSCGAKMTQVWENLDGSFTLFVFRNTTLTDYYGNPCALGDGSLRCGAHDFVFGYVSADEWRRIVAGKKFRD